MKLYELIEDVELQGDIIISHWNSDDEDFRKSYDEMTDDELETYEDRDVLYIYPIMATRISPAVVVEVG